MECRLRATPTRPKVAVVRCTIRTATPPKNARTAAESRTAKSGSTLVLHPYEAGHPEDARDEQHGATRQHDQAARIGEQRRQVRPAVHEHEQPEHEWDSN